MVSQMSRVKFIHLSTDTKAMTNVLLRSLRNWTRWSRPHSHTTISSWHCCVSSPSSKLSHANGSFVQSKMVINHQWFWPTSWGPQWRLLTILICRSQDLSKRRCWNLHLRNQTQQTKPRGLESRVMTHDLIAIYLMAVIAGNLQINISKCFPFWS